MTAVSGEATTDAATVRLDVVDSVAWMRLSAPRTKNAIPPELWADLIEAARRIRHDNDIRAAVLTGDHGEFCSGADLSGFSRGPRPTEFMRIVNDFVLLWHHLPKPTVAMVDGIAAGVGSSLALNCDLIVASTRARFCQMFISRGLALDGGASWLLPRAVGVRKAKELAMLGTMVTADEALRLGMLNRVVEPEELEDDVRSLVAELAAGPPLAMAAVKETLNASFSTAFDDALHRETNLQVIALHSRDLQESFAALREGRDPTYRGR